LMPSDRKVEKSDTKKLSILTEEGEFIY